MAIDRTPVLKRCRQLGIDPAELGYSSKKESIRQPKRRRKESEYGMQLREKRVEIGLTYIYGIGRTTATKICNECNINVDTRVKDLTEDEIDAIRKYIDNAQLMVEGDLRRERNMNVKRLMDIGCNRGLRHRKGLPVRGQRTHTNARTRKGPKRQIGAKKKK